MPTITAPFLRRPRWLRITAVSTVVGILCAVINAGVVSLPGSNADSLTYSAAVLHVMADYPDPSIVDRRADGHDVETLTRRAELAGRLMVSRPVLDRVARDLRVSPDDVGGLARTTASVPLALIEPASEQRSSDIAEAKLPYRLEVQARPMMPILDVYAKAPTTAAAVALAERAVAGVQAYVGEVARSQGVTTPPAIQLRPLGPAKGGPASGGASMMIGLLTFLTAFGISAGVLAGLPRLRAMARRGDDAPAAAPAAIDDDPVPALPGSARSRFRRPSALPFADDWPNTNRMLPWTLALFLGVLWLVPFNSVELAISAPIDLKFDRLVLPLVFVAWASAILSGGPRAPRLRMTPVHLAVAVFVGCAALSVVLNARDLNQLLELDLAFKKLPLLLSYTALFVIAATGIRAREIRPFMTYTFVLAVVMAVGMIWEYRFEMNPFYQWSDKLLPGIFSVTMDSETALDGLGRRMVRGSAGVPLEAVTMLAMALPIGLTRLLQVRVRRERVLYALGCCLLLAAMVATNRKSALLVPVAVVATMAYFRRRELLRLAPLGLVLVVFVSALSPGAIGSTVSQFTRSDRSAVPTTGDRVSDYDAVRPDVWTHLAFGRGWGSYNHESYRILDSEILHRLVEMGVLGLAAFLLMGVTVVLSARATIAARDETWAPIALMGSAAAMAFFMGSTLFDTMSFPHAPYIFLFFAGIVAVAIRQRPEEPAPDPRLAAAPPSWAAHDAEVPALAGSTVD